jgi:glycerol-3-phosphate dehydrogenase (NAD(P)+)
MTAREHVTVLGGGSWGTTVAALAARNAPTTLWTRSAETAAEINEQRTNAEYLDDARLPASLRATADIGEAVCRADVLVVGVPSHGMRAVLTAAEPDLRPWVPIISLAKGLEQPSRLRPTEIIEEVVPGHPVGVMVGPNLAREVLDGMAAASVVATADESIARALQPLFRTDRFRVYRNTDVLGSELGGVLKNVIAIASGMADGLGVGDHTRAMVITRGLAEITRLGVALGADARTFSGLTGLGDLMATCMSPLSRNRNVGVRLAQGETLDEITASTSQVAEGVRTVRSVVELAAAAGVRMPIAEEVDAVVNDGRHPRDAYRGLRRIAAQSEIHEVA